MSCLKTNALIHLIQALGPISHNISTTELNVHAKNFTKDLLCINKLDNKHEMKKFQTKSLDYQQANLVKITHAGQKFKTKDLCIAQFQRVHNLACVEKSYFSLPTRLSPSCPSLNMQITWTQKNNPHLFLHFHFSPSHPKILTHMQSFRNYNVFFENFSFN